MVHRDDSPNGKQRAMEPVEMERSFRVSGPRPIDKWGKDNPRRHQTSLPAVLIDLTPSVREKVYGLSECVLQEWPDRQSLEPGGQEFRTYSKQTPECVFFGFSSEGYWAGCE